MDRDDPLDRDDLLLDELPLDFDRLPDEDRVREEDDPDFADPRVRFEVEFPLRFELDPLLRFAVDPLLRFAVVLDDFFGSPPFEPRLRLEPRRERELRFGVSSDSSSAS